MRKRLSTGIKRLWEALNERRYGVRTGGSIPREQLGAPHGLYAPSSWLVLRHTFKRLAVSDDDVFVDYGSGLGRVLVVAARRPFKRVIGVEHSQKLNEQAQVNIERARHKLRCKEVELVTADASEWEIPDDVTVAYFFCPFPPEVFERVIHKLFASVDRRPRPLRLVYYFMAAPDRELLLATGRARQLELRTPRYLRRRFEELWVFTLLPRGFDEGAPEAESVSPT